MLLGGNRMAREEKKRVGSGEDFVGGLSEADIPQVL